MNKEDLQRLFDAAIHTETWVLTPPPARSWTEHEICFIDAIIRASDQIFVMSRDSMARYFYVSSEGYVRDIIESLPGFRPDPQYHRKPYPWMNKSSRIGTLNGTWSIYTDDSGVLSKMSSLLVGKGGSARIEVVRHVVC